MPANWMRPLGTLAFCLGCFVVGQVTSPSVVLPAETQTSHGPASVIGVGDDASQESTIGRGASLRELLLASGVPNRLLRFQWGLRDLTVRQLQQLWRFSLGKLNLSDPDDFSMAAPMQKTIR